MVAEKENGTIAKQADKKKSPKANKDKEVVEDDDDDVKDVEDGDSASKDEKSPDAVVKTPVKSEEEKKKEAEEHKRKYANWPLRGIKEPHEHDVLYGRGGGTNHHPGNKVYRKMVEDRKLDYVNSKRLDKPLVALEIIRNWRAQSPPGRFLKLDEKTGLWEDVGDKKAREKTSQALREKAPEIRRKQEEEAMIKAGKDPKEVTKELEKKSKETRFESGTKDRQRDPLSHAVLARDHSLGREILNSGEKLSVDGFTWNPSPSLDRTPSYGSAQGGPYPPGRVTSYGSHGVMPPHFPPSRAGSQASVPPPPPPPGPDYYPSMSSEESQRSFGSLGYDSWSRLPSCGSVPPPLTPYGSVGSSGNSPYEHHRSGSFGLHRDHSLSHNPLRDASTSQPAQVAFDRRNGSGYWGEPIIGPPPPAPPHAMSSSGYGAPRYNSGDAPTYPTGGYDPKYRGAPPSPRTPPPPPPYQVDPAILQSWTTQPDDYATAADMFGGTDIRESFSGDSMGGGGGGGDDNRRQKLKGGTFPDSTDFGDGRKLAPHQRRRPDMVKRMTSNQNEDRETKRDFNADGPSIKRAALNRDSSAAANRLKAKYAPGALKKPMTIDKEMRGLSISMEQSSLEAKPKSLSPHGRTSTIDTITMEIMTKPHPLAADSRSTTIDVLSLDLDVDVDLDSLPRPPVLRTEGRLSTAEYIDIVNEPLEDDEGQQQRALDLNREASVSEWLSQG